MGPIGEDPGGVAFLLEQKIFQHRSRPPFAQRDVKAGRHPGCLVLHAPPSSKIESQSTCGGGAPMPTTTFKEAIPPVGMRRVMRGTGHRHYAGERADRTFHHKFHQIFFVLVRQYS
jgi:hypothetical protein